jgi:HPt (histidine-containing phosphotransfer) domain-containing protein
VTNDDHAQIAATAHRLKGSGGTVGFDAFFEPAKQLESAAKAQDNEAVRLAMTQLIDVAGRARTGSPAEIDETSTTSTVSVISANDAVLDADKPIRNTLLEKNPQMRGIVEKFLPRREEQLRSMEKALGARDYPELAQLAHWLKGSGGTVGYDVFTEPAAQLEQYAKLDEHEGATAALAEIRRCASKIQRPGNDESPGQSASA